MQLLTSAYLPVYLGMLGQQLSKLLADLEEVRNGGAKDLMQLYESAVQSSQIEGSKVTLDLFKAAMAAAADGPKPRDVQQVHDLVTAYQFAQKHPLTKENLLKAHHLLSANLIHANDQGAWRTKGVKVGNALVTIYMAPHQTMVPKLMDQLFQELDELSARKLATEEAFYYAALLHLIFVKIHPFIDGNGRATRLLEKWFLAQHIGPITWSIRSEYYYNRNLDEYYGNLAAPGPDWGTQDWGKCVPFLLMLARAVEGK